ncbi:hypothetical protein OAU33_01390 [Flavobacteriaceae bacterium]|nr:hypothetical protein [Flavobacteriaceae bacterium]
MGLAPFLLDNVKGLLFFKFLGTGGGKGFSLWPDFSTYAFMGVWEHKNDYENFISQNPVFSQYQKRATTQRDLILTSVKSHGKWSGINPFQKSETTISEEASTKKAVVITRATLNWSRLISFWRSVPAASKAIENARGIQYYKGIGEWPFIQQATISIWDDFDAVNSFAYKGKDHANIVKKTRQKKWYKEDLFSRFYLVSDKTISLNS